MTDKDSFRAKKLEVLRSFCLFDDAFFSKCLDGGNECVEIVLSIILGRNDLKVVNTRTQEFIANVTEHSVALDIFAEDGCGRIYDIEIQQSEAGADRKRARFYSSMIDSDQLSKGRKYSEVPETYVIFITESDVMKKGDSVYFIERCIMNTGELFGDESHIVYVNGACRDDSPLGRLMHDFSCRNADEMHYKVLRDRVKFFKESKEGRDTMSKAMEDFGRLYEKRGEINGETRKARDVALRLLSGVKYKYTAEEIADISGLDLEEVRKLQEGKASDSEN